MPFKSNRSFSLVEVLIAIAIISGAIVYIFRAYAASLSAGQLSHNISLGCYLAQEKHWELSRAYSNNTSLPETGQAQLQGRAFNWNYEISDTDDTGLKKAKLTVTWPEQGGKKQNSLVFYTYFIAKK